VKTSIAKTASQNAKHVKHLSANSASINVTYVPKKTAGSVYCYVESAINLLVSTVVLNAKNVEELFLAKPALKKTKKMKSVYVASCFVLIVRTIVLNARFLVFGIIIVEFLKAFTPYLLTVYLRNV
jgi:hypothetical protein